MGSKTSKRKNLGKNELWEKIKSDLKLIKLDIDVKKMKNNQETDNVRDSISFYKFL